MEQGAGSIQLNTSDPEINAMLQRSSERAVGFSRHFSQGEDFFLRLGQSFEVPSFSIHHDIRQTSPSPRYRTALRGLIDTLQQLVPGIFSGLTYLFDPAEILRPTFFQMYRVGGESYLYMMGIDLVCRPQKHQIIERGTNDTTPVYRTSELVLDTDVIPLKELIRNGDRTTGGVIEQLISETWIGETGRGYFVQGIWLDTDLTKFFSKLILPAGKRIYPYYPFSSKYRSICAHPIGLDQESRRQIIPLLHRFKSFLRPHISTIEQILREQQFSESLDQFLAIKQQVPPEWQQRFAPISMSVYLNEEEQKEFEVVEAHDGDQVA